MTEMPTVLAVDDENDVLIIIKTSLETEGYTVLSASNGADALELAKKNSPDVILLDLMMPEMDGFEVLEHLKEDEETCLIPVVVLTGISEKEKIQQALDKGVHYYIVKPFEHYDLVSKVHTALNDARDI